MIAGGASLAPRRWSLPLKATATRSRSLCRWTARITAAQNTQELGVLRAGCRPARAGCRRVQPIDQLTCLPEPLMPANGFSCSRQAMPYFCATRCSVQHDHLLMIGGHVGIFVHRGQFVLGRRDFVVPRLDRHAQLEQLALGFEHAGQHALGNRAEVVVLEFLPLGRLGAVQRAAGGDQVGTRRSRSCGRSGSTPARDRPRPMTGPAFVWPNNFKIRWACLFKACIDRSTGVFLSSASPVQEQNAVGMHSVVPFGFSRM